MTMATFPSNRKNFSIEVANSDILALFCVRTYSIEEEDFSFLARYDQLIVFDNQ